MEEAHRTHKEAPWGWVGALWRQYLQVAEAAVRSRRRLVDAG